MTQNGASPYDAVLIVSFGGPESMDDVMPFLENVLRGRNIPRERMLVVAEHYYHFGGVSPTNRQNRALVAALEQELKAHQLNLPAYWGNRNWHPLLTDTLRQMTEDGIQHALAFITSPYSSYSSCRQYREDIARAQTEVGENAPQVSLLRKFYNHPGFIHPNVENVSAALDQIPQERRAAAHIAFTAHSIPLAMARNSDYETQLTETCQLIAEGLSQSPFEKGGLSVGARHALPLQRTSSQTASHPQWKLVYQSRSGSPQQPWLAPDIGEHLQELQREGVEDVVIAPVGFIADHMEVLYDLDTEAKQLADKIGLNIVRAATVGTHPEFIAMIRELIAERLDMGELSQDVCRADCCLPGLERPLAAQPVVQSQR